MTKDSMLIFKKKFPKSFKYLFMVKFITFLFLFITLEMDYQTYYSARLSICEGKPLIPASTNFYSQYIFYFYFFIVIYEFVLSVYVTLKVSSPVKNVVFQIGKHAIKAISISSVISVTYSYVACFEPTVVSNFVHTKTPLGRGYDYEIGCLGLKIKGDILSGVLGRTDRMSAVQKYAPDSNIIDTNKFNNIINDPEFKYKIRVYTTFFEKDFLGIPLTDTSSLSINPEGSDVSDLNNLKSDNN